MEDVKRFIRDELKRRKITQAEIAKMLNVKPPTVNIVICGKRKNPRIRKAIALAVGKPETELWPEDQPKPEEKAA